MLGLSGVAHAGYLLVAVMASMIFAGDSDRALWVLFFYLFVYMFASFGVFGVMSLAELDDENEHEFSDYEGMAKKQPFLAFTLVCGIASLAGIPPFAGFIAKLLLFSVAFEAGLYFFLGSHGNWCGHIHLLLFWVDQRNLFPAKAFFRRR